MTVNRWQLVITTPNPARAADFWRHALRYSRQPAPPGYTDWDDYATSNGIALRHGTDIDAAVDPSGRAPRLLFVRDDPDQRGSVSVEILSGTATHPATVDTITRRAVELTRVGGIHHSTADDHDHPWAQLSDPDGNPFRII